MGFLDELSEHHTPVKDRQRASFHVIFNQFLSTVPVCSNTESVVALELVGNWSVQLSTRAVLNLFTILYMGQNIHSLVVKRCFPVISSGVSLEILFHRQKTYIRQCLIFI